MDHGHRRTGRAVAPLLSDRLLTAAGRAVVGGRVDGGVWRF